jgi:hypothetical protein
MNNFWKAVLINIAVIVAIALLTGLANVPDVAMVFGMVTVIIAVLELAVGIFLLIFPTARRAAQIMLAAAGIVFLIGASVCSIFPMRFNFH